MQLELLALTDLSERKDLLERPVLRVQLATTAMPEAAAPKVFPDRLVLPETLALQAQLDQQELWDRRDRLDQLVLTANQVAPVTWDRQEQLATKVSREARVKLDWMARRVSSAKMA